MGGSYKQCECGKRALSIATRCPGCGREFLSQATPARVPTRRVVIPLSPRVVGWVLAAVAIVGLARLGQTSGTSEPGSSSAAADSVTASSEVAYAMGAQVRPEPVPVPAAGSPSQLLVARTWTSVRASRSSHAPLEAVLTPGDTVLADSLARDWYRVALDGEVLGYAHRSLLVPIGDGPP